MVFPNTVLRSIKEAIKSSGRLPEATTYAVFDLDQDGGQANVRPPIVELTTVDTLRSTSLNTDFVGYSEDANGNQIGHLYRSAFQMPIQINVMTAEGGDYNRDEIGNEIRTALYEYETRQEDADLPDPDNTGPLSDITRFQLGNAQPNDDLTMTPALRGWMQQADVWFEEVIDTAVEYGEKPFVETVDVPAPDEGVGGASISIVFDTTPSQSSTADDHA